MKWFANLKTASKLLGGFGLVLALTTFLGVYTIRGAARIDAINADIAQNWITGVHWSGVARTGMADYRLAEFRRLLATDKADMDAQEQRMAENVVLVDSALKQYAATITEAEDSVRYADVVRGWSEYRALSGHVLELARTSRIDSATAIMRGEGVKRYGDLKASLLKMSEYNFAGAVKLSTAGSALYGRTRRDVIIVLVACLLLGAGIALTIARMIARPLVEAAARAEQLRGLCIANLRAAAQQLAQGDLTVRVATGTEPLAIDTADEVGDLARAINGIIDGTKGTVAAFEAAVASMRDTLADVRAAADGTASAAQQLQSASAEISSGAQEQASSLEETAASLEEMTATIKQNADNAQQAAQLAGGAREVAEKGGHVVSQAVTAMDEINRSSKQIADIITTIDEIAFQTNLLALNAAVEAARAGQQGRGFAVVAGEVRKLAQRSATAAKEIKGLINDSVKKVENGSALVNDSGKTLSEIVTSVKRVTDIVNEIAAASREQATGIDQVNRAVTQMDQVTQANAGQTEELSGTAESLAAQAEQLQAGVAKFVLEQGLAAQAAAPAPKAKPAARRPAVKPPKNAYSAPKKVLARAGLATNGNGSGNGHHDAPALPSLDEEFEEY